MRGFVLSTAVAAGVAWSAPARALDGYQDRKGLFSALVVGGGAENGGDATEAGFRLGARVGGGLSQQLTADLDFDFVNLIEPQWKVVGFDVAANWFPLEHAFLRAGTGMSLLYPDMGDNKAGFGAQVGVGIEAFFGADLAASFAITYEPDFYGDPVGMVNGIFGTVAASWY